MKQQSKPSANRAENITNTVPYSLKELNYRIPDGTNTVPCTCDKARYCVPYCFSNAAYAVPNCCPTVSEPFAVVP